MKIYTSTHDIPKNLEFGLTIGNFDGVHLGHQYLLKKVKAECEKNSWKMLLLTFTPHPLAVLQGKINFLVSDYSEKLNLLKEYGVDYIVELPFDRDLSMLEPGVFLSDYLVSQKNIKGVFLGHDFSFGANKKGNHDFVYDYFKNSDVKVETLENYREEGVTYSSTKVRELLANGEVDKVFEVLGRGYQMHGIVKKGHGRGKGLGFATANLSYPREKLIPMCGVYITDIRIGDKVFKSLTNVGNNPTFNIRESDVCVENHILDFDSDLYGEKINVTFYKKIRDEKAFSSPAELVEQIKKDVTVRKNFES
jgi:riboflavin kinase/FMN adenylyltransferase